MAFQSFPSTPILDDFNRASIGAGWTANGMNLGNFGITIASSTLFQAADGGNESYWNATTFLQTEVYCDIVTKSSETFGVSLLYGRLQSPASAAADCYLGQIEADVGTDVTAIYRITDAAATLLTSVSLEWSSGDKMGLRITGVSSAVLVEVYRYTGGTWNQTPVLTYSDTDASRITTAGYIGAGAADTTFRGDNFGGGEAVSVAERQTAFFGGTGRW